MIANAPLTPAELELLKLNYKVMKDNGKFEPPDIEWEDLQMLLTAAHKESGRRITSLDELQHIGEENRQVPPKPVQVTGTPPVCPQMGKVIPIKPEAEIKESTSMPNGTPIRKPMRRAATLPSSKTAIGQGLMRVVRAYSAITLTNSKELKRQIFDTEIHGGLAEIEEGMRSELQITEDEKKLSA